MIVSSPASPPTSARHRRRARSPGRVAAAVLGFVALSAHLLLPLVYTCRTYRSLFLDAPPSCCAAKARCCGVGLPPDAPSWRHDGVDCPFCKAASPFRHANTSPGPEPAWRWSLLELRLPAAPRSVPPARPDLSSSSPRAPPSDIRIPELPI